MDQRVSMIMVGATDVARLRKFYEEGLGWSTWGPPPSPASVMYKVGHSVLVFLPAPYLAAESGIPAAELPKSLWAIFVASKAEVDTVFARAIEAGGKVTSPVRDRDGGLYSGYFSDPEGNGWEVVWSPHMPLDDQGALTLGG
jgi:predicted enzyme related to lactoylglutathione lyase